jgi:hypothetical protein
MIQFFLFLELTQFSCIYDSVALQYLHSDWEPCSFPFILMNPLHGVCLNSVTEGL